MLSCCSHLGNLAYNLSVLSYWNTFSLTKLKYRIIASLTRKKISNTRFRGDSQGIIINSNFEILKWYYKFFSRRKSRIERQLKAGSLFTQRTLLVPFFQFGWQVKEWVLIYSTHWLHHQIRLHSNFHPCELLLVFNIKWTFISNTQSNTTVLPSVYLAEKSLI